MPACHPWQSPNAPRDRIHMDFGEYNSKHFLVVIDAYSKWPEVCHMSSTSATHLVEVLVEIFAFHGFPKLIVSDNGPQFVSRELQEYLAKHHILHHRSAPYHLATNGLAEGMVKNASSGCGSRCCGLHLIPAMPTFCILTAHSNMALFS